MAVHCKKNFYFKANNGTTLLREVDCDERNPEVCKGCGWNFAVEQERRKLPLTVCEDGKRRVIIKAVKA